MAAKKKAAKKAVRKTVEKPSLKPARKRPVRRDPQSLRLREAVTGLTVNDIEQSIAWYRDVLGWTVASEWREGGGLLGAELVAGAVHVFLGQDDWQRGHDRKKGEGVRLYFRTAQDVDALAERIKAKGGVLDHEPMDQWWGERDFGITDPNGFHITISVLKPKKK